MYAYKETYVLDFSKVRQYGEIHQIIKDELDFPDYYGRNWDAFWDCLTEMVDRDESLHIELVGMENLRQIYPRASEKILENLKQLKHCEEDIYCSSVKIEIVCGDGRYELS